MEAAGVVIEDQHHAMFGDDEDDKKDQDIKDQGGETISTIVIPEGID